MLSFLLSWRAAVAGIVIFSAASFGAGYKLRDKFCDAAQAKARVAGLERQLQAIKDASAKDSAKAEEDAKALAELERTIHELQGKISSGDCLTRDDAERLRDLWRR